MKPCKVRKGHICQCEHCFGHKEEDWLNVDLFHNCPCLKCRSEVYPDAIMCIKIDDSSNEASSKHCNNLIDWYLKPGVSLQKDGKGYVWLQVKRGSELYPEYFENWVGEKTYYNRERNKRLAAMADKETNNI